MRCRLFVALAASAITACLGGPVAATNDVVTPPTPLPARNLRTLERNPLGYQAQASGLAMTVLLGDLLFHTPRVLGPAAQALGLSCQSCHPNGSTNGRFFLADMSSVPGTVDLSTDRFRRGADNGRHDPIAIPSLRGARYTGPYGFDGRESSLRAFIRAVVSDEFDGAPLSPMRLDALREYVLRLDFVPNSNVDRNGHLRPEAPSAARRGEKIFFRTFPGLAGKACANCHDPAAFFRDGRAHRRPTPYAAAPESFDDGIETPTLLNITESAPYFHDGRAATLGEVVEWYHRYGGLSLDDSEKRELVAYLAAVGALDRPSDDRPLAKRFIEEFAYLLLLLQGPVRDDRDIWSWTLELVRDNLLAEPAPAAVRSSAADAVGRLERLRATVVSGADLSPNRPKVRELLIILDDLAADWAGAVAQTEGVK